MKTAGIVKFKPTFKGGLTCTYDVNGVKLFSGLGDRYVTKTKDDAVLVASAMDALAVKGNLKLLDFSQFLDAE